MSIWNGHFKWRCFRRRKEEIHCERRSIMQEFCFPTPMKDLDRLGVQNENIAINVFGWQNDRATVYKISEKTTRVPPINLMMAGSREIWHHSYMKSEKSKHFVAPPKKISGKKTLLFAVLVNIYDWRNFGKAWRGLQRHWQHANENRNAKRRWFCGKMQCSEKTNKRATQKKQAATLHVDMRTRWGAIVKHQLRNSTEAKMPWKSFWRRFCNQRRSKNSRTPCNAGKRLDWFQQSQPLSYL